MPQTEVWFYREGKSVPVLDWLDAIHQTQPKVVAKSLALIDLLRERGMELRRPQADYLDDGFFTCHA